MRMRPIMRYHGGKFRLAPWIISLLPPHRTYVEPFGGAASVLLRKKRSYAEIYNDLDSQIVNVFSVLRDKALSAELQRVCELTPFSRAEFELSYIPHDDPVEQARRTIFRSFAGYGSAAASGHNTGFRANATRLHTTPADDWAQWPQQIATFTQRLRRVIVESRDAVELMNTHNRPNSLYYVDPPYVTSTRNTTTAGGRNTCYRYEMTDDDHEALLTALNGYQSMIVLSGYDCDLYRDLLTDWHIETKETHGDGRSERTEILWLNDAAMDALSAAQSPAVKVKRSLFTLPAMAAGCV